MRKNRHKVLMIGPARSVHGGISGVVNNYYEAGLDRLIDLYYIGTMVEGSKGRKLLCALRAYCQFLMKLPGFTIVHVNMASDSSYYRKSVFIRTASVFRKKVVIHQHGGNFPEFYNKDLSDRGRWRVRRILSSGDAFLVLAVAWKDFFGTLIGRDKITVLPDAIRIPAREEKRYGVHKILFLGRLCRAKGIGELLAVMPRLQKRWPDVRLYLAGIWEDVKLKEQAAGMPSCVTDLGWISGAEKHKYLQECDIFVMPSYFEGQSVSILEAMACSCGIVASDTGGIPDMILEGETGLLTPPGDADALEEGLARLLAEPALCRRLGENARRKVEAEFSMENNIKQLMEIYDMVDRREFPHDKN